MWEILLTRLFTVLTLSAGDVKDSDRIYDPPRPSLLSLQSARASVVNVSKLNMHQPERK